VGELTGSQQLSGFFANFASFRFHCAPKHTKKLMKARHPSDGGNRDAVLAQALLLSNRTTAGTSFDGVTPESSFSSWWRFSSASQRQLTTRPFQMVCMIG